MYRVGILGCGSMGSTHAGVYRALSDRVKVVAVADVRPDKGGALAADLGAAVYGEAMELLEAEELDFVDICLPTYLHAKYTVAAVERGFHVLVEKPVALTVDEAREMIAAEERTGKLVQVGQVIRFWDEYVYLKKLAEAGTYGRIVSGHFSRLSPRPSWSYENWLHDPAKSGGMAIDFQIHDADFIRALMGEPLDVRASGCYEESGAAEYMMTDYFYENAVITAEGAWNYPASFPFSATYRVKFARATVVYDDKGVTVYEQDGNILHPAITPATTAENEAESNVKTLGGYANEILYFLRRIEDPTLPNLASLAEAAKSLALCRKALAEMQSQ